LSFTTSASTATAISWQRYDYDALGRQSKERLRLPTTAGLVDNVKSAEYSGRRICLDRKGQASYKLSCPALNEPSLLFPTFEAKRDAACTPAPPISTTAVQALYRYFASLQSRGASLVPLLREFAE
jgi:hypothetical protein